MPSTSPSLGFIAKSPLQTAARCHIAKLHGVAPEFKSRRSAQSFRASLRCSHEWSHFAAPLSLSSRGSACEVILRPFEEMSTFRCDWSSYMCAMDQSLQIKNPTVT